jgi:perosamine synthetase
MISSFATSASDTKRVIVQNRVKKPFDARPGFLLHAEVPAPRENGRGEPSREAAVSVGVSSGRVAVPTAPDRIPRLPVLGWSALASTRGSGFPSLLDRPRSAFTASGRMAIALALRALGVSSGDSVLVPTYHCPTMIAPVAHCGATPVFFPIDARGGADLHYLRRLPLHGAKAMIAAHYFGFPRAMENVRAFCDERGLGFIEDCAHAMFGGAGGRGVGEAGDFAIGSLTKFFAVPEGGYLVSNVSSLPDTSPDPAGIAAELKAWADTLEKAAKWRRLRGLNTMLRLLFRVKSAARDVQRSVQPPSRNVFANGGQAGSPYDFAFDARRPPAAVRWIVTHSDQRRIVSARRRNYLELKDRLRSLPGTRPLFPDLPELAVPYVFPLWVDNPEPTFRAAWACGLPVFRWDWLWPSTAEIPGDAGRLWARHVFQLPCHQDLSDADLEWMTATLRRVFSERR